MLDCENIKWLWLFVVLYCCRLTMFKNIYLKKGSCTLIWFKISLHFCITMFFSFFSFIYYFISFWFWLNILYFLFFPEKTYFLQGEQFWEFYDNKMRTRRINGKPISKLLGCRNGKLNSNLMALEKEEEESSASGIQLLVSNLVILLICIHVL